MVITTEETKQTRNNVSRETFTKDKLSLKKYFYIKPYLSLSCIYCVILIIIQFITC